jgi:2-dehydropantoate 2-reductase
MMSEASTVARALGANFSMNMEDRIDLTGSVGAHKTSMLQDLERGRPMEIDALLSAVVEMAGLTGTLTPLCQAILALIRGRASQAGLYHFSAQSKDQGHAEPHTACLS